MEDMGIPAYVPHKDTSHIDPTPLKIYETDMKALNKAQILIAEVSHPGLGTGMEIGISLERGIPVICLAQRGSDVSLLLLGAKEKGLVEFIEYEDWDDCLRRLRKLVEMKYKDNIIRKLQKIGSFP